MPIFLQLFRTAKRLNCIGLISAVGVVEMGEKAAHPKTQCSAPTEERAIKEMIKCDRVGRTSPQRMLAIMV